MEGFIQIKRHKIHHDALESRFRRSPAEENPRPGYQRETPRARRSIYLNDCLRGPRRIAVRLRLAFPLAASTSRELISRNVVALSILHYTETSVEDLILFPTCPLGTLTDSHVVAATRLLTDLYLALRRKLQRDRVGVEFFREQQIFETLHLLAV